ncbi:hypothetical protein Lade_0553 [Legionella adelaidensis]|uniref:Uncharacterized protein n=1 Tax=Legionella adelaidensis TaxID=45056 RepID=A0A0W0R4C6_9GAMM|nr:hypothetical protein [Legionella adelaidensis]KTC65895.1 hypothetical protein Lade_0553 [Legionella adelaidensis]
MSRKIGIAFICFLVLTTKAFSMERHVFTLGTGIEYDLPAKDPQLFSNFLPWEIRAECRIITEESDVGLKIIPLNNKGCSLDGAPLTAEGRLLHVNDGSTFLITAKRGVHVEITNQGEKLMKVRCSTV